MIVKRESMRQAVLVKTRGEIIPIISMNRTIEIREEEAEDKDLEEEASIENIFTMEKKGIEHLNVPNAKEGHIKEYKSRLEL